jgi:hypothetical protein
MAALRIQNQARRVQAADRVEQVRAHRAHAAAASEIAAEGIQSVFRGWCSRREVFNTRVLPMIKEEAVTKIQAEWRKFHVQSKIAALQESLEDEGTPRSESEMWQALEERSTVKIQSLLRGAIVRKKRERKDAAETKE